MQRADNLYKIEIENEVLQLSQRKTVSFKVRP